jgi:putative endonuclease
MEPDFFYVYVLRSLADRMFYVGYTRGLRQRFCQHQSGEVPSTRERLPVELVYCEACRRSTDATRREKYLKSAWGKRFLKSRIRDYLTG